ncbi:MAG: hypothetical protein E7069_09495 [Bacteroidales bacterium]|jgi:hypothetical protein|nr:hypothetical protein [Bacteroidales bacterium]
MNKSLQVILFALLATACSEEIDMTEQTSETITYSDAELEKIAYGCDYYLDEDKNTKVETRATDEYLEFISESLKQTQSSLKAKPLPTKEASDETTYVGVIMRKTCGKYNTIKIYYDSEDKDTRKDTKGDTGSWGYDGHRNLNMYFCRVPFNDFPINVGNNGYALLRLSTKPLTFNNNRNDYTYILSVHMDAEDKHEATSLSMTDYKGTPITTTWENDPDYADARKLLTVSKYGDLNFDLIYMGYYNEEKPQGYSFPDYGFDYSVFGYVTSPGTPDKNSDYRGYIYTDDEDKNNGNHIILKRQNNNTGKEEDICDINDPEAYKKYINYGLVDINFRHIIEYSKSGTMFYMTKVNPKDIYE